MVKEPAVSKVGQLHPTAMVVLADQAVEMLALHQLVRQQQLYTAQPIHPPLAILVVVALGLTIPHHQNKAQVPLGQFE
jgi:hypothetical protein